MPKWTLKHDAMPAVGYVEPWSVEAGRSVKAHISSVDPAARIRVVSLDRDQEEEAGWAVNRLSPRFRIQEGERGSWIELADLDRQANKLSLAMEFCLTSNTGSRCLISLGSIAIYVKGSQLCGIVDQTETFIAAVENERWYMLACEGTDAQITICAADKAGTELGVASFSFRPGTVDRIDIGWLRGSDLPTINARIGRIDCKFDDEALAWRFPTRGPVKEFKALGSDAVARLHNMPTFAVASARFTGEVHDPRLKPDHFDAVHLHDDDFGGFDWAPDLEISIPEDARSGIFAVAVETSRGTEKLPFFVRARRPQSKLAFLVPTATYLAYADERLPRTRYPWHGDDRAHRFANDNGLLCLYDVHSDLSGVSLVSSRRPRATLRDDYHYPLSNCPHNLPVDLQFLKFCHRTGIAVDIVTDHDLHELGAEGLEGYRGLLTGSHPEYWSRRMMDGLDGFLSTGGNLGYLGGNGFYWVVAFQDDVMELRRGKSDIWTGRPGEAHLSITGEPGGNWEDRGLRNPQSYLGVTFVIMDFGPSQPYRRLPESYADEYAWLFDGVGDDAIGIGGSVLGGAAGYEIDAMVRSTESPASLVRLATADTFGENATVRPDLWLEDGDAERDTLRRADLTVYRHKGGGLVFCTGSVAWLGALPDAGRSNPVGTITANLARKFAGRS